MAKTVAATVASALLAFTVTAADSAPLEKRDLVESHDILLLDVSQSMDMADIQASFRGVTNHYLSDEAMMNYKAGICTANTVIYFGSKTQLQPTRVLCSERDVRDFLAANIDEGNLKNIRRKTGGATKIAPALMEAIRVFEGEKDVLNIEAMRHRVVIAGDGYGGAPRILRVHSRALSARFGATVNAVAIGSADVQTFFNNALVTPPQTKRIVEQNGRKLERPIAAGTVKLALDSDEASRAFQTILSLGAF